MATANSFNLLGDDDNDDVSHLIALQQQKKAAAEKLADKSAKPGAKLPSKPLPPAQAVKEANSEGACGVVVDMASVMEVGMIVVMEVGMIETPAEMRNLLVMVDQVEVKLLLEKLILGGLLKGVVVFVEPLVIGLGTSYRSLFKHSGVDVKVIKMNRGRFIEAVRVFGMCSSNEEYVNTEACQ